MTIIEQLVQGSAKIDKMRSEIDLILGMVESFLTKSSTWSLFGSKGVKIGSAEYKWILSGDGDKFCVRCERTYTLSHHHDAIQHHYFDNKLPASQVAKVHAGLEALVQGMFDIFPDFKEKCQPMLDAASDIG